MKKYSLIQEKNFEKARKEIKNNKKEKKKVIFTSDDDELNRKVLEKEPINMLLLNQEKRKDRQKQRDSGLNQVLAKIAKDNRIIIGINLDEILNSKIKIEKRREILARVKQNIKLCNKNKLKMAFIVQNKKNNRDIYDLRALGLTLGMPTWMTKTLEQIRIN